MTPPSPPHTTTARRRASSRPTARASESSGSVAWSPGPTTATYATAVTGAGGVPRRAPRRPQPCRRPRRVALRGRPRRPPPCRRPRRVAPGGRPRRAAASRRGARLHVQARASLPELLGLGPHARLDEVVRLGRAGLAGLGARRGCPAGCRCRPQVVADAHRAELGPAHRAEVRGLRRLGRERLVVERPGGGGIERQVELVLPAELEARPRERIVPG